MSTIFSRLFCLVLVLTAALMPLPAPAQSYTTTDSIAIYRLLNQADELYVSGTLERTMSTAREALQLAKQHRMMRGQALATLKIASVLVKMDEDAGVPDLLMTAGQMGVALRDSFIIALAAYQRGQLLMYQGKSEEAERLFMHALAVNFNQVSSGHKGHVYNDLGYLYGQKGDVETQVRWLLQAIRVHEQTGDLGELAVAKGNLAVALNSQGNRAEAISYTKEAIVLKEKVGDMQGLSTSYGNLANIFASVSLDSASFYMQKAAVCAERNNLKTSLIQSYTNLSAIYDQKAGKGDRDRNKREALNYILQAIDLCRQIDDERATPPKLRWAAQLSSDLNDTIRMEQYFQQAMDIARRTDDKPSIRDIYGARAHTFEKRKEYQPALENLKTYYRYRDSLSNERTATNIAELRTQYETEKKDNEISRLETDRRLKQLSIEKQQAVIAGDRLEAERKETAIRVLSQQQQLRDARIRQQEEELDKQLLLAKNNQQALQLADKERELRNRQISDQRLQRNLIVIAALLIGVIAFILFNRYQLKRKLLQQRELLAVRNNIARDLHDEIGSTLTSIRILSQVSHNNLSRDQQKAGSMLEKITEQSEQMQQGMSDIVWAISPHNDRVGDIVVRMREYIRDTLEPRNIAVELTIAEDILRESIGMTQRRDLFLVFKEAINNISKYAGATRVLISLAGDKGQATLRISDDGKGFEMATARASNGLRNMRARAAALQGSLDIVSSPGQGTIITLKIPV